MLGGQIECKETAVCKLSDNIDDILKFSLDLEKKAISDYKAAIELASEEKDFTTADLLTDILNEEENHKRWLELQLELFYKMGKENYILFISK